MKPARIAAAHRGERMVSAICRATSRAIRPATGGVARTGVQPGRGDVFLAIWVRAARSGRPRRERRAARPRPPAVCATTSPHRRQERGSSWCRPPTSMLRTPGGNHGPRKRARAPPAAAGRPPRARRGRLRAPTVPPRPALAPPGSARWRAAGAAPWGAAARRRGGAQAARARGRVAGRRAGGGQGS